MKSFILTLFLLLLGIKSYEQTTFNRLYTSYQGTNNIYSIVRHVNQYYCLFGQLDTINPNGYQQMGIIKLDSAFNVIDSNLFDSGKVLVAQFGKGFTMNDLDTTFLFVGDILFYGINGTVSKGYISKIDKNLDTVWTRQISHPDTAYADTAANPWVILMDAVVDAEGNYLISGNYNYQCQGNYNRSFIIKMDPVGNIIWQKLMDPSVVFLINDIEIDPLDSTFYISSKTNPNLKLIKINSNGVLLWSFSFGTYQTYAPHTLKLCGNIMLIANRLSIASNLSKPRLLLSCVDKVNKTTLWSKIFYSISVDSPYLNCENIDIEVTDNGNIAIATVGFKTDGEGVFYWDHRAYLLLLNQNGDSLWSHYYTYQNDSADVENMQFADMVVCPDGGFLFGGSYYSFPNDPMYLKAWLVKTDSLGNAPGMFTVGIEEEELVIKNIELKIYPNPTSDNINLRMDENPRDDLQLEIYNISGQLVMQQQLAAFEQEHRVNIQNLQSGIYLVKLKSGNEEFYSGKVVKE